MLRKKLAFGLFSNLQGLEIGARKAGFDAPFSSDIDKLAKVVAPVICGHAGKDVYLEKDIKELSFQKHIRKELAGIGLDI